MKIRKVMAILIIFVFMINFSHANGSSENALNAKLNKIQSEKKQLESIKNKLLGEKKQIQVEVKKVDKNITVLEQDVENLEGKVEEAEKTITNLENSLNEALKKRELYYDEFKKRSVRLYKQGDSKYLQVVLKSKDAKDFLNKSTYVQKMAEHDNDVIASMKDNEAVIAGNVKKIENQKGYLETTKKNKEIKKASLEEQRKMKAIEMQKIENDVKLYEKKLKELERESNSIANSLKKLKSKLVFGGTFMWPVGGYSKISSPYGNRIHPVTKKASFHTGIDIPAPTGTAAKSAADGQVVTRSYMNGYGNVVVIDHGNKVINGKSSQYSSLYAHNSAFVVSNGSKVKQGETITKIGSTGMSTGPHLHFEIRINGQTTNPSSYVRP